MKEVAMGWEFSTHGREYNPYESLVENPEGNRPLGRRKGNIKMDNKQNGYGVR
jgi:hypothetical protein